VRHYYEVAWDWAFGVSFALTIIAGSYFGAHGMFWRVAIPWYLFGYLTMVIFCLFMYRKYSHRRQALIMNLCFSLVYALFWFSFILAWGHDELKNRRRPLTEGAR